MSKLKPHSPIYYMMDNWENWINFRHTLDSKIPDKYFICSMSSDKTR